jgi:hypothetical protein
LGLEAADTRAGDHADPRRVEPEIAGLPDGVGRGGVAEVRDAVLAPYFLGLDVLLGIEVLHLAGEADRPVGNVDALNRTRGGALRLEQGFPKSVDGVAGGRLHAHAGHDNASAIHE